MKTPNNADNVNWDLILSALLLIQLSWYHWYYWLTVYVQWALDYQQCWKCVYWAIPQIHQPSSENFKMVNFAKIYSIISEKCMNLLKPKDFLSKTKLFCQIFTNKSMILKLAKNSYFLILFLCWHCQYRYWGFNSVLSSIASDEDYLSWGGILRAPAFSNTFPSYIKDSYIKMYVRHQK